jgi:hypothetical protein
MSALRRLRNFWIPWVAMIVLGCFTDAVAQTSYKVTDLGTEGNDILGCAMSLNNEGWTEVMAQNLPPGQQDSLLGTLLNGRLFLDIDGFKRPRHAGRNEHYEQLGRDQRFRADSW